MLFAKKNTERMVLGSLFLLVMAVLCKAQNSEDYAKLRSENEKLQRRVQSLEQKLRAKHIFAAGDWVDLTHDFSSQSVYWPTADSFQLKPVFEGMTKKGYYYSAFSFCAAEHGGTHIDAPVHFAEGAHTLEQIPLNRLIGPAIVVAVEEKALANRDYQASVEDFVAWETTHGKIADGSIVLIATGYSRFWPDREKYMGTAERGDDAVKKLHFPGLDPKAAQWLVENRTIAAIGIDTPSIDYGQSQDFLSHRILFKHNIPAFENVARLDQVPAVGAFVIALPMKIKGGSGGPLRIVALR